MMRAHWPPRLIADAHIAADGTIRRSVGIRGVNNPVAGTYEVLLDESYQENETLHVSVTPSGDSATGDVAAPHLYSVGEDGAPSDELIVSFQDGTGADANTPFTIRVYRDA